MILGRLNLLLLLITVCCALAIVNVTDRKRYLFVQLERATADQRRLVREWTRLRYEQSMLSKIERIERIAMKNLKMKPATPERTIYLNEKTLKPIGEDFHRFSH